LFREGRKGGKVGVGARVERPQRPPDAETLARVACRVDADQATRYAAASGDRAPIHVDDDVARSSGLPGVILHGMCTLALATQAVVRATGGSRGRTVERVSARFTRPVLPGDMLTTTVWARPMPRMTGTYLFETRNQRGERVLRRGIVSTVAAEEARDVGSGLSGSALVPQGR